MKKVNDELEKNKQLLQRIDNIDETVCDNIKHYIDNSLICSNNNTSQSNQFTCSKCNKQLTSKRNLINHESKCDGLDSKQCKIFTI